MGTSPHAARIWWQHELHLSIDFGAASQRLDGINFVLVAIEFANDTHALSPLSRRLFRWFLRHIALGEAELHFAVSIDVDTDFAATHQFAE